MKPFQPRFSARECMHWQLFCITTTLLALLLMLATPTLAQSSYRYLRTIAQPLPGQFQYPISLSTDSAGNLYVADMNNNRIQKFDSDGNPLMIFGGLNQPGALAQPQSVTPNNADSGIYVANFGYALVTRFDSSGKWLGAFGGNGTGNGQFQFLRSIVRDSLGNIYAADGSSRVQKFDKIGKFLIAFGSPGSGNGQFSNVISLSLDSAGNILVADTLNARIQKFDKNGVFLSQFGNSDLSRPENLATDSADNIYVTDSNLKGIVKFDKNGKKVLSWGGSGNGNGQFQEPAGIAVDLTGNVWVSDTVTHSLQKFDKNGVFRKRLGEPNTLFHPRSLTFDLAGNLLVTDFARRRVVRFSPQGDFLDAFSAPSALFNSAFDAYGIGALPSGDILVTEFETNTLFRFGSAGNLLGKLGITGSLAGQFHGPAGVTTDATGAFYIADKGNNRIQKFNSRGQVLGAFGSPGNADGQLNSPEGIAVDSVGNLWVSDETRIQKFDATGRYLLKAPGFFPLLSQLTTDDKGSVFATVGDNAGMIRKFNSNGAFVTAFGVYGSDPGQVGWGTGIAVDNKGNVYVADPNNSRITVFTPSTAGLDIGKIPQPSVIRDAKTGDLLVTVIVINIGSTTITAGKVAEARLNAIFTKPASVLPTLLPGGTTPVTLRFPSSAAQSGTHATITVYMNAGPRKDIGTAQTIAIP